MCKGKKNYEHFIVLSSRARRCQAESLLALDDSIVLIIDLAELLALLVES